MKRWLGMCAVTMIVLATPALATFHSFQIEQVYSNADGTVQFLVLHETQGLNDQNLLQGRLLTVTQAGVSSRFAFPINLPNGIEPMDGGGYGYGYGMGTSPTALSRVLIATQGFAALGIIVPDYIIPNGFLPTGPGTINYAGVDQWTYAALPTDGVKALYASGATATNKATNFAGMSASVQTTAPPAVVNYEGLWWKSPAGSESGWGINFAHQGDVIFATWFTYDLNGKAWWLSMTANKTAEGTYAGTLVQTRGPAFSAVPFSPAAVVATAVGTATLTFSDRNNGSFAYTVNGVSQTKAITRQVFATPPTCTFGTQSDLSLASNYQDLWWAAPAGAESGWGVNFTHQSDIIFATWFTYDVDGTPLWLSATAPKTAPGVYSGALQRTTGPAFNAVPFLPANVALTPVGTLTITFANGNSANYAYTVTLPGSAAVSQTKSVTRQVFRAPGTACS